MRKVLFCFAVAGALALGAQAQASQTVTVVATHGNLYLAGQPDGTLAAGEFLSADNAPLELSAVGSHIYTFAASGHVNFIPIGGSDGPDGDGNLFPMPQDAGTGISGPLTPENTLLGLFLTGDTPTGPAPASLDFSNMDFATVSPGIGQIFVIGDGFRADGLTSQQFVAPVGATRLYLGTFDGCCWNDDFGTFNVTVTDTTGGGGGGGVPEPTAWALMVLGFGGLGAELRRRRGAPPLAA